MRLKIGHQTVYRYNADAAYALLQLRVRPRDDASQSVEDWKVDFEGAHHHAEFPDHFGNRVDLIERLPGHDVVRIIVSGVVETTDRSGMSPVEDASVPLWLYYRSTKLTEPTAGIVEIARSVAQEDRLKMLHQLSATIREAVTYISGETSTLTTAGDALRQGQGVCQDHTHIFLACARSLGVPARYVGGYLMMDDREDQDAGHAWAEAYVDGLGWVGFDISNGISPDERYVGVARGLDFADCTPTRGLLYGGRQEALEVAVQVQQ